ncbi:molecular chaperone Tir [Acidipropionibacterium acidipropionici]|uniref:Molecular chaperone Tir n=1 Tax=Acidipropionibacterium acidipropionici TaxID=1748 RepID=A0AAC8YED8_9ACTN|nr:TIR domain-containing protein [Acidipropionibacterium acidipropionici]AMS04502.1 molecular chaperone Tir [Acidipropionibacterium acidipropionici]AOZ45995.1 molecular chaperone Tir [Acidipropionibacterium acidipropionici]AZP37983.1 molecular chaperone Tir [Acidipropionibacterium acidipropionici]
MSYRNKTYVAFASEDIRYYRLMTAWRANDNIEFDFINAHDIYTARDSSTPETIKRRLRERLNNTKQVVLLGSADARRKGGNGNSFLAYEVGAIISLNLPVVVANLDGSRQGVSGNIPAPFASKDYYTMSVSFGPTIIKYALDNYAPDFAGSEKTGSYFYKESVYERLGLNK